MKATFIIACLLFSSAIRLNAQWGHVGPIKDYVPGNKFETGRLDCITPVQGFNGTTNQKIYAGSSAGGLWLTTDFCNSWNPVQIPDNVTYHGISALAISPGGYMLAATCNRGYIATLYGNIYQFFPSTNTWVASDFNIVAGTTSAYTTHIRVCRTNSQIVMASASNGVYRSVNGGLNWSKVVLTGSYENVEFVPGNTASGYFVYACGDNAVIYSTDFGLTFTTKTSITTLLGSGYYADMAVTFDASNLNQQYIYFDALTVGTSSHRIVRLSIHKINGTESVNNYGTVSESASSTDRMCTAAYDKVVYFGNGGLVKLNAATNNFYQINSGNDFIGAYVPYGSPGHADSHDALILPAPLNRILYVNDGGCYVNSFTPSANSIYSNSWMDMNNNLNISQIFGMSCAEEDENEYMTGEQDTKAFRTNSASTTFYSGGVESFHVLIDKFNKNNFILSVAGSVETVTGSYNGTSFISAPHGPSSVGGNICVSQYSDCGGFNCFPGSEFSNNTLFQDPNRPDKIFFGTKNSGLLEFCPSSKVFTAKKIFPESFQQFVKAIAFSRADKNKVYASISSRNYNLPNYVDLQNPELYVFNDLDFDDSWLAHNDSWQLITPNFTMAPFTTPVNFPQTCEIEFVDIAVSDWNADKMWTAIRYAPGNPGLKVIKREAGAWTDYSTGIPPNEIPISLIYEQGTNDQLYLGTNVNVYVRNATMSSWIIYSTNLPNIAMNQLRMNYKENTIRVGTYGHGMWKSSFQCPPNTTLNVTGTIFADNFYEAQSNITVQNHTVATGNVKYRSGTAIDFLPEVEIISSSTVTAFAFIHGCNGPGNTFWKVTAPEQLEIPEFDFVYAEEKEESEKPIEGAADAERIYPNPTTGSINIEVGFEIISVLVYNVAGGLVSATHDIHKNEAMIDLNQNPQGMYFVKVVGSNNTLTRKIVKQ
jgi:hypothetical protein